MSRWTEIAPLYPLRPSAQAWKDEYLNSISNNPGVYEIGFLVPEFRTHFHNDSSAAYPDNFRPVYVGKATVLKGRYNAHAAGRGNWYVKQFIKKHSESGSENTLPPILRLGLFFTCFPVGSISEAGNLEASRIIRGKRQKWYHWNGRIEWKPIEREFEYMAYSRTGDPKKARKEMGAMQDRVRKGPLLVFGNHDPIPDALARIGLLPSRH